MNNLQSPTVLVNYKNSVVNPQDALDYSSNLIKEVKHHATDIEAICYAFIPGGKPKSGNYLVSNPCRDDQHPSFSISLKTGAANDFASGDKCGDIVSTIRFCCGYATQLDAAKALAQWLGMDVKLGAAPDASVIKQREAEAAAKRAKREAEAAQVHKTTADIAAALWQAGRDVVSHAYLEKKHVSTAGLRCIPLAAALATAGKKGFPSDKGNLEGDLLIAPLYRAGALTTVELIDGKGGKHFLKNGETVGAEWIPAAFTSADVFHIAEGVATALSVDASGAVNVSAAMSLGNIRNIVQARRAQYSAARIVICADIKKTTGKPDDAIIKLAQEFHCAVAYPLGLTDGGTDFNDLHVQSGLDAVRDSIDAAVEYSAPAVVDELADLNAEIDDAVAYNKPEMPSGLTDALKLLLHFDPAQQTDLACDIFKTQVWRRCPMMSYESLADCIINAGTALVSRLTTESAQMKKAIARAESDLANITAQIEGAIEPIKMELAALRKARRNTKARLTRATDVAKIEKAESDLANITAQIEKAESDLDAIDSAKIERRNIKARLARYQAAILDGAIALADAEAAADSFHVDAERVRREMRKHVEWQRKLALETITIDPKKVFKNCVVKINENHDDSIQQIEDAGSGCFIDKAPQGCGKTKGLVRLAKPFDVVNIVAPLKSLVASNARIFGIANYESVGGGDVQSQATCLPSITNPLHAKTLNATDFFGGDEFGDMIDLCHTGAKIIQNHKKTFNRLTGLMESAKLAVGAHADINTLQLNAFARAQYEKDPNKIITVLITPEPKDCGRTVIIEQQEGANQKIAEDAIKRMIAGGEDEPIWYPIDSAKRITGLTQHLKDTYPEIAGRIHEYQADDVLGNNGESDTIAQTRHFDDFIKRERPLIVIPSPMLATGFSIETPDYFKHVLVEYGGHIDPRKMNQFMTRVRDAKEAHLEIIGGGTMQLPQTVESEILGAHKINQSTFVQNADGKFEFAALDEFDGSCAAITAFNNRARNRYAADLLFILEARGWAVQYSEAEGDKDSVINARQARRERRNVALVEAADIAVDDYVAMKKQGIKSTADNAEISKFELRRGVAKQEGDLTESDIELYQDGDLNHQKAFFEDLTQPVDLVLRDELRYLIDRQTVQSFNHKHRTARRVLLQQLFAALGFHFDGSAIHGTFTSADIVARMQAILTDQPDLATGLLLHGLRIKPLTDSAAVKWTKAFFKRGGCVVECVKRVNDVRHYAVVMDGDVTKTGIVRSPGLRQMIALCAPSVLPHALPHVLQNAHDLPHTPKVVVEACGNDVSAHDVASASCGNVASDWRERGYRSAAEAAAVDGAAELWRVYGYQSAAEYDAACGYDEADYPDTLAA